MSTTRAFIGGRHVDTDNTYDNIDPATGGVLSQVCLAGVDEVDRAVACARAAHTTWRRTTPEQRGRLLATLADRILDAREELARLESEDTGKPLSQATADAEVCARYFRFYANAIDSYYGITIPLRPDLHTYTMREPYGVTGHIVAWNYPLQLFARGVAPAIATGNCSVVKPADETPRTSVRVAELATEAGLPDGVMNVVPGTGAVTGHALANHPGIDHLGFVGSTEVGTEVAAAAAERVVPVILELGGKSGQVVFDDADLEVASRFVVQAILQNAGQTCSAGSRLIVNEHVHDELVSRVVELFEDVRIGRGTDDPDLGPLVSKKQLARVRGFVAGLTEGEVLSGGMAVEPDGLSGGAFYAPTLITGVDPSSEIAQEEVFGPVLTVMSFGDDEEAVALANGTDYALLAAVWTKELSRAHRMAAELRAGQVYINTYGAGGGVELPFGGFGRSGYGREKGREALDTFTETKTIVAQL